MKTDALTTSLAGRILCVALGLCLAAPLAASAQSISGQIRNNSVWLDNDPTLTPPGGRVCP